jgi:hypothetical protein
MGTCGSVTYSVAQADGSAVPSALQQVNDWLLLKTTDSKQVGVYTIKVSGTLASYPTITSSVSFKATVLNLYVPTDWQTDYQQIFNDPSLVIVPTCRIDPSSLGYTINYTIDNQASLPSYLTVGTDKSVTLPSANKANQNATFTVKYSCGVQSLAGIISRKSFQATGKLLPCTVNCCTGTSCS